MGRPGKSFPKVIDRGLVADAVKQYLVENPGLMVVTRHRSVNQFCTTLASRPAAEISRNCPALVYYKFRRTATEMPSLLFDNDTLFRHAAGGVLRLAAARPSHLQTPPGPNHLRRHHELDQFMGYPLRRGAVVQCPCQWLVENRECLAPARPPGPLRWPYLDSSRAFPVTLSSVASEWWP